MRTRVLRRPIVLLRVRFSICVRWSILILLIKTVRCSIRSLQHRSLQHSFVVVSFVVAFLRFSILILSIKTFRCSIVRCSIPHYTHTHTHTHTYIYIYSIYFLVHQTQNIPPVTFQIKGQVTIRYMWPGTPISCVCLSTARTLRSRESIWTGIINLLTPELFFLNFSTSCK